MRNKIYNKLEEIIKQYKTAKTQTELQIVTEKIDNMQEPLRGYCIDFINEQDWDNQYENQYVIFYSCENCNILWGKIDGVYNILPKQPF